jgi:hypothetical protein
MLGSDLTTEEQENVRAALRFLMVRAGGLRVMGKAIRWNPESVRHVLHGRANVSASMVIRVARLAQVGIDDLLTGKYPVPGTCPHCGRGP